MGALLIVDDDTVILDTLYELFEGKHLCHMAQTAEQALAYLEAEHYDVVLTDISMPGMSGLELLGLIQQRWPDTLVIVISVLGDREYVQGLVNIGAFDYLIKPFDLEEVEASVAWALWHRRNLLEDRHKSDEAS